MIADSGLYPWLYEVLDFVSLAPGVLSKNLAYETLRSK